MTKVEVVSPAVCGSIVEIAASELIAIFCSAALLLSAEFPVPVWQAVKAKSKPTHPNIFNFFIPIPPFYKL